MIKKLQQKKFLLIFGLLAFVLIFAAGFFFASKKSEPVYLSKIDQLMFDKDNKAPKYVLVIPDKVKAQKPIKTETVKVAEVSETQEPQTKEEVFVENTNKVLSNIPLLAKLPVLTNQLPLQYIEVQPALSQKQGNLVLPAISEKGQKPWAEYGNKVDIHPNFYKVAILIRGIGFEEMLTGVANKSLPSEISFSFSPYGKNTVDNIKASRQSGHETYLDLLLSSKDFLKSDSGPMSMRLTDSIEQNIERLKKSLSINAPVGGVVISRGIADDGNKERLNKMLDVLKNMGLLVVDATGEDGIENIKTSGLARDKADVVIDKSFMREAINKQLEEAEKIALSKGQVLIVAEPKPVVLIAIDEWIKTFSPQPKNYEESKYAVISKPLALVPISSVVSE